MAGLTVDGFEALTYDEIVDRIESRLEALNPGFDFSVESPDGQLIAIMAFEVSQVWDQLDLLYGSFDPRIASGQALKNIGLISGILKSNADRSFAFLTLVGVDGVVVPAATKFSDSDGQVFVSEVGGVVPGVIRVIAEIPGPVPVPAGGIDTIDTAVAGLTGVVQAADGEVGKEPESEQHYRNRRTEAVMASTESVADSLRAKLILLGLDQVSIINNDGASTLEDGTPPGFIHITATDSYITNEQIAEVILKYKSLGTPTYGNTSEVVVDSRGHTHTIYFSRAASVSVAIELDVTFLGEDFAGAEDSIKESLIDYINTLETGEDVIWSRLFGLITPYGKAQVNSLLIGDTLSTPTTSNISIPNNMFANLTLVDISLTVT